MDTIAVIKRDLEQMLKQRAELEQRISELKTALGVIARYEPQEVKSSALECLPGDAAGNEGSDADIAPSKPIELAQAAALILQQRRWTSLTDLAAQLRAAGKVAGGKDPVGNLSTVLSRHREQFGLISDRQRGWNVKDADA